MTKAEKKKQEARKLRFKQLRAARKPSEFNIASFDQATKCGVAYQFSNEIKYHTELWDLSIGSKESQGMKWIRFESRVRNFFKEKQIQLIAYELPSGRNINPIIHSSKLIAILEKVAVEMGIEYLELSSSEIKKFATGNGNANKSMMIEAARKLWGYDGNDDNESDALHILNLFKSKIQ